MEKTTRYLTNRNREIREHSFWRENIRWRIIKEQSFFTKESRVCLSVAESVRWENEKWTTLIPINREKYSMKYYIMEHSFTTAKKITFCLMRTRHKTKNVGAFLLISHSNHVQKYGSGWFLFGNFITPYAICSILPRSLNGWRLLWIYNTVCIFSFMQVIPKREYFTTSQLYYPQNSYSKDQDPFPCFASALIKSCLINFWPGFNPCSEIFQSLCSRWHANIGSQKATVLQSGRVDKFTSNRNDPCPLIPPKFMKHEPPFLSLHRPLNTCSDVIIASLLYPNLKQLHPLNFVLSILQIQYSSEVKHVVFKSLSAGNPSSRLKKTKPLL